MSICSYTRRDGFLLVSWAYIHCMHVCGVPGCLYYYYYYSYMWVGGAGTTMGQGWTDQVLGELAIAELAIGYHSHYLLGDSTKKVEDHWHTLYLMPPLKYPTNCVDSYPWISLCCTGFPPRKSSIWIVKIAAAALSSCEDSLPKRWKRYIYRSKTAKRAAYERPIYVKQLRHQSYTFLGRNPIEHNGITPE